MAEFKVEKKTKRSPEDIAKRSEEAAKGMVFTSAPGMTEAELAGAETREDKEAIGKLIKDLKA